VISLDNQLTEGLTFTKEFVVQKDQIADFLGSGKVAVLSTPSMILMMEQTAMLSVKNQLAEGNITVGTHVNVSHLRAAKLGAKIKVDVKLQKIEKKHLTFSVVAYANGTKIGEGFHERHIVNKEKFLKRLE
jgi:predicted thioesterase